MNYIVRNTKPVVVLLRRCQHVPTPTVRGQTLRSACASRFYYAHTSVVSTITLPSVAVFFTVVVKF